MKEDQGDWLVKLGLYETAMIYCGQPAMTFKRIFRYNLPLHIIEITWAYIPTGQICKHDVYFTSIGYKHDS